MLCEFGAASMRQMLLDELRAVASVKQDAYVQIKCSSPPHHAKILKDGHGQALA